MNLKIASGFVIFALILTVFTTGCTTSNTSTATPTATPTAQATANTGPLTAETLAGAINDYYKSESYTVNTPFNMTKSGDNITYTGVITDGPKVLEPYKHNITIVLTPDRTSAKTVYQAAIDNQTAQGYLASIVSNETFVYWTGYLGTTLSSTQAPRAHDALVQPESDGTLRLPDSAGFDNEFLNGANTGNYFEVITDLATYAG
jgi:hypothetical protein